MFKYACIFLYDYLIQNDLLFKVKFTIPAHDEINIESPEEIADEMSRVLVDCMERAGAVFCTNIKLGADVQVGDC